METVLTTVLSLNDEAFRVLVLVGVGAIYRELRKVSALVNDHKPRIERLEWHMKGEAYGKGS